VYVWNKIATKKKYQLIEPLGEEGVGKNPYSGKKL
jgi:hypothetical protein